MQVVFIHGPPASGKHTIGTALSGLLKIPLFHNHLAVDLAAALFEFGTQGFALLRERAWLAAFETAAAADQSFIFTFAPESTVDPALIATLVRIVRERGGKTVFIEVRCSETHIEERIAAPSRAAFGKLRDVAVYRALRDAGALQFPALPTPLLVVDSGVLGADIAAVQIDVALTKSDL